MTVSFLDLGRVSWGACEKTRPRNRCEVRVERMMAGDSAPIVHAAYELRRLRLEMMNSGHMALLRVVAASRMEGSSCSTACEAWLTQQHSARSVARNKAKSGLHDGRQKHLLGSRVLVGGITGTVGCIFNHG
jgi:hypothetical protein